MSLSSILLQRGIFVWWSNIGHANISQFIVQFRQIDTPKIGFSSEIVGTTHLIENKNILYEDIQDKLEKVAATTNVYSQSFGDAVDMASGRRIRSPLQTKRFQPLSHNGKVRQTTKQEVITEVRVSGNVTGILIPNTSRIDIRVIVGIHNGQEEFEQDIHYVEWETVCVL